MSYPGRFLELGDKGFIYCNSIWNFYQFSDKDEFHWKENSRDTPATSIVEYELEEDILIVRPSFDNNEKDQNNNLFAMVKLMVGPITHLQFHSNARFVEVYLPPSEEFSFDINEYSSYMSQFTYAVTSKGAPVIQDSQVYFYKHDIKISVSTSNPCSWIALKFLSLKAFDMDPSQSSAFQVSNEMINCCLMNLKIQAKLPSSNSLGKELISKSNIPQNIEEMLTQLTGINLSGNNPPLPLNNSINFLNPTPNAKPKSTENDPLMQMLSLIDFKKEIEKILDSKLSPILSKIEALDNKVDALTSLVAKHISDPIDPETKICSAKLENNVVIESDI